jgi:hydrogenase-4 membrane subunit HyfE
LTLFVVGISTLVLILLIFNFYSWPFYRSFICFQFHSSISIYHIFFCFHFDFHSFDYFIWALF